ncbi:MAG: 3-oxoacyl-[acyl-carrier protein] reductase [Hyphomicrobiaceae bacterium]|jgi:3-oxoacyl-[acyl-carrier protein] reductase
MAGALSKQMAQANGKTHMQVTMNGRNALITGGSLGIGRAIASRFVESGGNVALVARRQDVLDEAKAEVQKISNCKVIAVSADVGTAEGCQAAIDQVTAELGQIDILVNNAGTSRRGDFESITDEMWQNDIDLKLFGAIRLARAAMPGMKERKWGRIINVLNTGAKAPPASGAPTAVTRAAGMALTKVLAGEGAKHNVLVNAVLVGRIESDQWVQRAKVANKDVSQIYKEMSDVVPMGRIGTAEEFANIVTMLASDQGSYVTGTAINIDGGMSPVV